MCYQWTLSDTYFTNMCKCIVIYWPTGVALLPTGIKVAPISLISVPNIWGSLDIKKMP